MWAMQSDAVVHVIDDDDAVRESLAFLLKSARLAVKTYESAAAFLGISPPVATGCVITDVRMPDISGIELLQRLRERNVSVPVIVITGHGDVPLAVEAMKLGAVDFFEKPFDDEALLAAVRSALSHLADSSKRDAGQADINGKLATLSNREREVLEGLVSGHPNKTIAYDLGISPRTVEVYRANVMTKMNAASLSDLVRMALVAGILDRALKPDSPKGSR
jgi:two-component system, LuxR family, response regulator FixJ